MFRSIPVVMIGILGLFALHMDTPSASGTSHPSSSDLPVQMERLDPAVDALLPEHPVWHRVATGFTWVEGPIWIHSGDLMFAEIASNSIRKIDSRGKVSIWLEPSGYQGSEPYGGKEPGSNGMTLDSRGRLTVAGHAARNVVRFESMDPHGTVTILADSYQGKKLNSPNDLVYGSDGSLYFTDPPYGLRTQNDHDPHKELAINGVYRIPYASRQKPGSQPDRSGLQLLVRDLPRPNGIAFSPDGKWLYVSNSEPKRWMRYSVNHDGTLGRGTIFVDAANDRRNGAPDGIKVDTKGNLFAAGPGGVWIISPEGKHMATLLTEKNTANMAWGGADGRTLYTTTTDAIFSIRLNTTGVRP